MACAVLHNMAIKARLPAPEILEGDQDDDLLPAPIPVAGNNGLQARDGFIQDNYLL